ncbi:methyltransferase-like protein 27 isoform X2 [Macrobrachium rosenbergii]|uniref:methyltransferase-like protein 27 isoform X2 n=1 Tax=Macrobrachium rosenbergii TaxID=79674 RepID=UPI0034D760A2
MAQLENTAHMSPDEREIYLANFKYFPPGASNDLVIKTYTEWAPTYVETLRSGGYTGYVLAADEVASRVPEDQRHSLRVLDVAAGVGSVGLELSSRGFKLIDALEPSEGMMKRLETTGVYTKKYLELLGDGAKSVPSDAYDVLVCSGGMLEGHIPAKGIDDMIRITKPGGLIVIVMRAEFLHQVEEYKGLERYFDSLQEKGNWTKLEKTAHMSPDEREIYLANFPYFPSGSSSELVFKIYTDWASTYVEVSISLTDLLIKQYIYLINDH